MSVALLREMFDRMVVAKNAELIEHYYDPDFLMYSDGLSQSFAKFRDSHRKLYATAISYAVEYDEHAWVEAQTRLPGGCGSPLATWRGADPHRGGTHCRLPQRPNSPDLGDDVAELAQRGRPRRLLRRLLIGWRCETS